MRTKLNVKPTTLLSKTNTILLFQIQIKLIFIRQTYEVCERLRI